MRLNLETFVSAQCLLVLYATSFGRSFSLPSLEKILQKLQIEYQYLAHANEFLQETACELER